RKKILLQDCPEGSGHEVERTLACCSLRLPGGGRIPLLVSAFHAAIISVSRTSRGEPRGGLPVRRWKANRKATCASGVLSNQTRKQTTGSVVRFRWASPAP